MNDDLEDRNPTTLQWSVSTRMPLHLMPVPLHTFFRLAKMLAPGPCACEWRPTVVPQHGPSGGAGDHAGILVPRRGQGWPSVRFVHVVLYSENDSFTHLSSHTTRSILLYAQVQKTPMSFPLSCGVLYPLARTRGNGEGGREDLE